MMADRTQRALGLARRNAHQHAFDRAFQGGGEVADPPPDDPQGPVEPYTMAQPDYMRPKPPLEEQVRGAIPEPLWEAGSRIGEALRTGQPPSAEDYPMIAAGAILGTAGPKGEGAAERAVGQVAKGIRAYHGSPYDFPKFSMEHVGSGEGAQAYGHGLYFAEAEPTARTYKMAGQTQPAAIQYQGINIPNMPREQFAALPKLTRESLTFARDDASIAQAVQNATARGRLDIADELMRLHGAGDLRQDFPVPGHMYEVNINADPEHFLDWDKPLSEQHPKVREIGEKFHTVRGGGYNPSTFAFDRPEKVIPKTGEELWHAINMNRGPQRGTEMLRQAGIPGIKYLDQGSRNVAMMKPEPHEFLNGEKGWVVNGPKGDVTFDTLDEANAFIKQHDKGATHNYVVFDDKLIDIIKKYGLAGLIAGGAAHYSLPASEGVVPKQRAKGGKVTASQMSRRHAHQEAFDKAFPRG